MSENEQVNHTRKSTDGFTISVTSRYCNLYRVDERIVQLTTLLLPSVFLPLPILPVAPSTSSFTQPIISSSVNTSSDASPSQPSQTIEVEGPQTFQVEDTISTHQFGHSVFPPYTQPHAKSLFPPSKVRRNPVAPTPVIPFNQRRRLGSNRALNAIHHVQPCRNNINHDDDDDDEVSYDHFLA